ncbi:MAG: hypothetical protein HY513_02770 [Candidatus Aenigmarchaeota archaeon]|nr:hypothetical protein [Candidatus Aenigmarchaeota archaeon]
MSTDKTIVFVCMVEQCKNSDLYRQLSAIEELDVRNANCRGYCALGNRIDVYDPEIHRFAESLPENPNLSIEALGGDPVGKILEYVRKLG